MTCGILHGSMPDALVLCHQTGREVVHGYESFALPEIPEVVDCYESLAQPVNDCSVVGGALNTSKLDEREAKETVTDYEDALGAPATDPVRFDGDALVEVIE